MHCSKPRSFRSDQAKELARLLAPLLEPSRDEGPKEAVASEATIVKAMVEIQHAEAGAPHDDDIDAIGVVDDGVIAGDVAPAGFFDFLDPRPAIRLASLYLMKDRAGKVGSSGVAELLRGLLQRTTAPVHVVGHSFGCKVMLSAAAAEPSRTGNSNPCCCCSPQCCT
jgi:hypothetical protein